jgi:hypothetical protein
MKNKSVKTCKFEKLMGANVDGVRSTRIEHITSQARNAINRRIILLEDMLSTKNLELDNLMDLAPDTTDSLRPGGKNFEPNQFIERILKLKKEIMVIEEIDLKIAKATYTDLFEEEDNKEE